jgi:hypothetical protein
VVAAVVAGAVGAGVVDPAGMETSSLAIVVSAPPGNKQTL